MVSCTDQILHRFIFLGEFTKIEGVALGFEGLETWFGQCRTGGHLLMLVGSKETNVQGQDGS